MLLVFPKISNVLITFAIIKEPHAMLLIIFPKAFVKPAGLFYEYTESILFSIY